MGCRNCKIQNPAINVPPNTPLQYWNNEKKDAQSLDSFKQPLSPKALPLDIVISHKEVSNIHPYSNRSTTVGTPAYTDSIYNNDIENSSIVYETFCQNEYGKTMKSQHIQKLQSNDYYAYSNNQTNDIYIHNNNNSNIPSIRNIDEAVRRGFEACVYRDLSNAQSELKRAEEYIAALDSEEHCTLTPVSSIQSIYDRDIYSDDLLGISGSPMCPIFKEQLELQKIRLNNLKETVAALTQYQANFYTDKTLHTVSVGDKREQYLVKAIAYNNQASICQN